MHVRLFSEEDYNLRTKQEKDAGDRRKICFLRSFFFIYTSSIIILFCLPDKIAEPPGTLYIILLYLIRISLYRGHQKFTCQQ